jgi:hypothetical protein
MAIGARVTPELIAVGTVIAPPRRKEWDGEYTGLAVTIDTAGGPLVVTFPSRDGSDKIAPNMGESVVIVATVYDGANGSTLTFGRFLSAGDLDLIASYSGALASSGK